MYSSEQRLVCVCIRMLLWQSIWFYFVDVCSEMEGNRMHVRQTNKKLLQIQLHIHAQAEWVVTDEKGKVIAGHVR